MKEPTATRSIRASLAVKQLQGGRGEGALVYERGGVPGMGRRGKFLYVVKCAIGL